jgi:hypothetical protein
MKNVGLGAGPPEPVQTLPENQDTLGNTTGTDNHPNTQPEVEDKEFEVEEPEESAPEDNKNKPCDERRPTKETLFDSLFESAPSSSFTASTRRLKQPRFPAVRQLAASDRHLEVKTAVAPSAAGSAAAPAASLIGPPSVAVPLPSSLPAAFPVFPQAGLAAAQPVLPLSVDIQAAQRVSLQPMFSPDADSERPGTVLSTSLEIRNEVVFSKVFFLMLSLCDFFAPGGSFLNLRLRLLFLAKAASMSTFFMFVWMTTSVADPDPWIWILLFSSMAFKMATK